MNKKGILATYGTNYTAMEYVTNPAIGRDEEIKKLILTILTPEKSAILTGQPGIGKTAIIEGLAYNMQIGNVPDALKGYQIIGIKTASLLGTDEYGSSKVQMMIDELKTYDKTILFIDEIHMLIGATSESSLDFANIFKEGLGRGQIKIVGATTTQEYEIYILRDKAFTRRFQRIDIAEPSRDLTIQIMVGTLPKIEKETGVKLNYSSYEIELLLSFLTDMTSQYKRVYEINTRYPDCALTLLKQVFSFAQFDNRNVINMMDFENAIMGTHLVYQDVKDKEIESFRQKFKDLYDLERTVKTNRSLSAPSQDVAGSSGYAPLELLDFEKQIEEEDGTFYNSGVEVNLKDPLDLNINPYDDLGEEDDFPRSISDDDHYFVESKGDDLSAMRTSPSPLPSSRLINNIDNELFSGTIHEEVNNG